MEKSLRLKRLEVSFGEEGAGAQATFEEGYEVEGRWLKTGETTQGLNAGRHAEYAATIASVVGEALPRLAAALEAAKAALEEERQARAATEAELAEAMKALSTPERLLAEEQARDI